MKGIDELLIQPADDGKLGLVFAIFLRFFEHLRCKVIGKDCGRSWLRVKRVLSQAVQQKGGFCERERKTVAVIGDRWIRAYSR